MYVVTIDTGTTNTRVCLWQDGHCIDSEKRAVGVRNTSIDGNNSQIVQGIGEAFGQVLSKHQLQQQDVSRVLASGMITSNLGLLEVPHVVAPVNAQILADKMQSKTFSQICDQPIWFVPGVKNFAAATADNWEAMDVMRGEEVEALAVLNEIETHGPMLIVLPGSHTKFVAINEDAHISGCCTTLAGELTAVVTSDTILSSSLDKRFPAKIDSEYLVLGAKSAKSVGLTRSLFSVRVLEQSGELAHHQLGSFLMGAIVSTDIDAFMNSSALNYEKSHPVYVCGDSLLAQAFSQLLAELYPELATHTIAETKFSNFAGAGSIGVARAAGLLN